MSELLGHASIEITLDLYSHCSPSIGREAAEKLVADAVCAEVPESKSTLLRSTVTMRRGDRAVILEDCDGTWWVTQRDPFVYGPDAVTHDSDLHDESTARVAAENAVAFLSLLDRNALKRK